MGGSPAAAPDRNLSADSNCYNFRSNRKPRLPPWSWTQTVTHHEEESTVTPSEAQRLALREQLIEKLEEGPATTLMESLPPMDWNELATKTDLAALEERLDAKFERLDAKFERVGAKFETVEARIDKGLAKQTYVLLAGVAAIAAPLYVALFIALFTGAAG